MYARARWSLFATLALGLAGCISPLQPPAPPPELPPFPPNVPPQNCVADGTCTQPPEPPGPPEPVCVADDLTGAVPLDVTATTTAAPVATDAGTCGDHASGPVRTFEWTAPASGSFAITATADFAVVLDIRQFDCNGDQQACALGTASSPSTATIAAVPMARGGSIAIEVAGVAGASGNVELQITRNPDSCGDNVCENSETCDSCPDDCGTCDAGGGDPGGGGTTGGGGGGIDTGGGGGIDTGGGGGGIDTGGGGGIDTGGGGGDTGGGVDTGDGGDDGGGIDDGGDDGGDDGDDGGDDGGDDDGGDDGDAIRAPHHASKRHVPAPTPNAVSPARS